MSEPSEYITQDKQSVAFLYWQHQESVWQFRTDETNSFYLQHIHPFVRSYDYKEIKTLKQSFILHIYFIAGREGTYLITVTLSHSEHS